MTGTLRLKNNPQEGKDTDQQTVTDSQGFKWHLAPNETKVLPDDANRITLASNATVDWGTTTQQAEAPHVDADIAGIAGRS
jgi:hypothetical protein